MTLFVKNWKGLINDKKNMWPCSRLQRNWKDMWMWWKWHKYLPGIPINRCIKHDMIQNRHDEGWNVTLTGNLWGAYCEHFGENWSSYNKIYIDGLAQDNSNSIANALELLQSYTKPMISPVSSLSSPRVVPCSYHNRWQPAHAAPAP